MEEKIRRILVCFSREYIEFLEEFDIYTWRQCHFYSLYESFFVSLKDSEFLI